MHKKSGRIVKLKQSLEERKKCIEEDEIDFMEVIHTLIINKKLIFISIIITTIIALTGGVIYNKKNLKLERSISLNRNTQVDVEKASSNIKINNFTLESNNKKSVYTVVTEKKNKNLLDSELNKLKVSYEQELIKNNTLPIYTGEKEKISFEEYLNSIISQIKDEELSLTLLEIKDSISPSKTESVEELRKKLRFLEDELVFYKEIVLNYKLQNKTISFTVNQNTIKFLPDILNSTDISYNDYKQFLDKYIALRDEINLSKFKLQNFDKFIVPNISINIDEEIEKVNKIVTELNLSKEDYIKTNIDTLISFSEEKDIFTGKPISLFLGVGIIFGGIIGMFMVFFKELITDYKKRYSN